MNELNYFRASKERGPTTQSNESIKPSKEKNKTGVSGVLLILAMLI